MSPNNPSNFVSDLVEMAKAFEELPKVQAALAITKADAEALHDTVQSRELSILGMKSEIDLLNQRIRSLEVERDEAQFHALEADDRTARALDFIKATFGNAGSLIQALEPPRVDAPQPVDAAASVSTMPINSPEPEPTKPIHDSDCSTHNEPAYPNGPCDCSASQPVPEVATQPDPTPTPSDASTPAVASIPQTDTSVGSTVTPTADALSSTDRPYAGKTWTQWKQEEHLANRDPYRLSQGEWLAGGGTVDNWYA